MTDKIIYKIGAVSFILGLFLIIGMELLHPNKQPPANSVKAFEEYSHSAIWSDVHVGQFFAVLFLMYGFIALYRYLKHDDGITAALSYFGLLTTIVTISIFAVLQAVDGFTLHFVIERWIDANALQKDTAYRVAESVRWIEVALNGYFRILFGVVLILFGAAVSQTKLLPRWPGWIGILGGITSLINGIEIGKHGFVPNIWATISLVCLLVWAITLAVLMWSRSNLTPSKKKQ